MIKLIKQSNALIGLDDREGASTTLLPLEKRSDARESQLNWLEEAQHIHPKVVEWERNNPADPDKEVHAVVVPLGACESWAQTYNGDAFERKWLRPENPNWGHLTFEKSGRGFLHHKNDDPTIAFGDTPCMGWNDQMDRAEGIFRLDLERAKRFGAHDHVMRMLGPSRKYPSLSMGCKVKHDVCSLCGNLAPTADDYCIHPTNPGMGNIDPETGELMCVYNPEPWFFDLSIVIIKAAVEALVLGPLLNAMKAAAHYREKESGITIVPSAVLAQDMYMADGGSRYKTSSVAQTMKISDIIKEVPVMSAHIVAPVQKKEPGLSAASLHSMGMDKTSLPSKLSSLAGLGILLNPYEFADVYSAHNPGTKTTFDAKAFSRGFTKGDGSTYIAPEFVQLGPVSIASQLMKSRSVLTPFLLERVWSNITGDTPSFDHHIPQPLRSKLTGPVIPSLSSGEGADTMALAYGTYIRQAIDGLAAVIQMAASLSKVMSMQTFGSSWQRLPQGPKETGTAGEKKQLTLQAGLIPAYINAMCGHMAGGPVILHALNQLRSPNVAPLIGGIL